MAEAAEKAEETDDPLGHIIEDLRDLAVEVDDLVLDPDNARRHPDRNLRDIKASLTKFGQRTPLVVRRDSMVVEKGNGTLMAARDLGWKTLAAVFVDDDHHTATAFGIADNRTGESSDWDADVLAGSLQELQDLGENLIDVGFEDWEFGALLEHVRDGEGEEEEAGDGRDPDPIEVGDDAGEGVEMGCCPHCEGEFPLGEARRAFKDKAKGEGG